MDVKQLNYFVQIAKYGSYSLASQKLYISQPALSKVIKNMEEEMGFTFFYTYPVSYTHLDVYKRQFLQNTEEREQTT